jgi:hypothetical protein
MRGDFFNISRAVFLRLSMAFGVTTMVALYIYVAGNVGSLSDKALLTAARAAGGSGFITLLFGLACIVFAILAKKWGARTPVVSLLLASLMAIIGFGGAMVSVLIQSLIGGIAF